MVFSILIWLSFGLQLFDNIKLPLPPTGRPSIRAVKPNDGVGRAYIEDEDMETKVCRMCGRELSSTEFYRRRPDAYDSRCKSCLRTYNAERRKANPEAFATRSKLYYASHISEHSARSAKWNRENSDRKKSLSAIGYEANRDKVLARQAERRRENPEHVRALGRMQASRRRARLMNAPGEFTVDNFWNLYYMQDGKCEYCNEKRKLTIDHVIPLGRSGSSHSPDNIVLACQPCNDKKGMKLLSEWRRHVELC